jgi:hypothetical protein
LREILRLHGLAAGPRSKRCTARAWSEAPEAPPRRIEESKCARRLSGIGLCHIDHFAECIEERALSPRR